MNMYILKECHYFVSKTTTQWQSLKLESVHSLLIYFHDWVSLHSATIAIYFWGIIDCLVQDCSNSIANVLELLQSCTRPSIPYRWASKCVRSFTSSLLYSNDTVYIINWYKPWYRDYILNTLWSVRTINKVNHIHFCIVIVHRSHLINTCFCLAQVRVARLYLCIEAAAWGKGNLLLRDQIFSSPDATATAAI